MLLPPTGEQRLPADSVDRRGLIRCKQMQAVAQLLEMIESAPKRVDVRCMMCGAILLCTGGNRVDMGAQRKKEVLHIVTNTRSEHADRSHAIGNARLLP
jgi:hypothetical protein